MGRAQLHQSALCDLAGRHADRERPRAQRAFDSELSVDGRLKVKAPCLGRTSVKPAERLRLGEGSLPGSNKEDQFLGARIDPDGLDRFQDAPLPAISDRKPNAGL